MNKKLSLVVGAAIASAGLVSSSAYAANATASASATVLSPLTLTAGAAMNFGNVAAVTGAASTVVLTPAGGTSSADGAVVSGTPAAGAFSVTGDDSLSYTILLPASTTLTGGTGPDITVDNFTDSKGGTSATPATALNTSGGADNCTVGATLNLADGQGSGTYSGTYSVTVNYE